ncbi:G5 domain-containing protein [Patescibacteria group bacterium]|nr:G5 domain-containing protein [Patescibacteria group bacterium]
MKINLKIADKFYLLAGFVIAIIVMALIFNSLSEQKSIAMTEKERILGINDQKVVLPLPIVIKDNEQEWRGVSDLTDTKKIIKKLEVPLYPEDLVLSFPDPNLKIGTTITINRAPIIYLNDGGFEKELRTRKETISELFEEKNINLGPLDKMSIPLDSKVENRLKITITRVGERYEEEEIVIPYDSKEIADSNLLKGIRTLKQEGANGKRIKKYHLVYENGVLVINDLVSDEITVQPKNKIVVYGTKILVLSTDSGKCSWTYTPTASRRYKKGTKLKVINLANGKSVTTIVGGWGPERWTGRILDLNISDFQQIANLSTGVINIKLEELAE